MYIFGKQTTWKKSTLHLNKGTNKKNAPLWQIFIKLTVT